MKSYQELKKDQQKELDDFEGIFFAFSDKQFEEGMEKVGLSKEETSKIYSLGAGGYILKDRSAAFAAMLKRQGKEKKERSQEEKFMFQSLVYELNNYEYCITCDPTEALEALDMSEADVPAELLKKAKAEAMQAC